MIQKIKFLCLLLMIGSGLEAAPFIVRGLVTNNSTPATQKWVRVQFPQGGDTSVITNIRGEYLVTINPRFRIGTVLTSFTDVCGFSIRDTNNFDSTTTTLTSNLIGCNQPPPTSIVIKGFITNMPIPYSAVFINYSLDQFRTIDSVRVDSNGNYQKIITANSNGTIEYRLKDCNVNLINDSSGFSLGDSISRNFNYCRPPANSFYGKVIFEGLPVTRNDVFLLRYKYNSTEQKFNFIDTLLLSLSGRFSFANNTNSDYLLKAMPATGIQPFSATYFPYGATWSSAKSVAIGPHTSDSLELIINLNQRQIDTTTTGIIAGEVRIDEELKIAGYSGIGIHLLDINQNPIDFVYADASGNFIFEKLIVGEYLVWLDQCGVPTNPVPVSITSSNESVDGLILTANQLGISYDEFVSIDESSYGLNNFRAFPNPFSNHLKFHSSSVSKISVTNLMGQPVFNLDLLENETWVVDTEACPVGFYVINIHSKTEDYSIKLLQD